MPRLSGMCKVRTCGGLIGPQVGANTLVAALYPDYCFLINLTGKPWIGGCGKMCVGGQGHPLNLRRNCSRLLSVVSEARPEVQRYLQFQVEQS